jgi:hypothetical protein
MAYSTSNPPWLVTKAIGSTAGAPGRACWQYASTHVQAVAAATGFFTDGKDLGMTLGDSVYVIGSNTTTGGLGPMSIHIVSAVTSTGVGLSSGLLVSSAS